VRRSKLVWGVGVGLVVSSLALALVAKGVFGTVPSLISFQGILRDGTGNPVVNGSYSVAFIIYDAATGVPPATDILWSETRSVTTSNGLFSVHLGASNPIPDSVFEDTSVWLGITVPPDPEMTPRQQLVSVGYSFRSNKLDGPLGGTPVGSIVAYGGTAAPTGWLLCDGSAVSRTIYDDLFAILGTTYGAGDGSTTFNLPDLRQRFPLGLATAGTGSTLGETGGAMNHTHTYSDVIAHTHSVDPPSTPTSAGGTHTHGGVDKGFNDTPDAGGTRRILFDFKPADALEVGITPDGLHSHSLDFAPFTSESTGVVSANTASNNPPFLVVNNIIKY